MADERRPRPVSGEIMTDPPLDAAATRGGPAPGDDIVDAEYETVQTRTAQSEIAADRPLTAIATSASPRGGMDMLRRPDAPSPPVAAARGGPIFWAFGIGLVAAAFWVSGGHALVRGVPFFGQASHQKALRISSVTSRVDASGARPVLFVDGEAANDGDATEKLPPLEIVVAGNDGLVTRYRLGTAGRPMAPGETFAFSSRLDVPKNGVKTVSVTFGE